MNAWGYMSVAVLLLCMAPKLPPVWGQVSAWAALAVIVFASFRHV